MMRAIIILLLACAAGTAMAQESSFDREFSKFDKDFERLNHWKADIPASKKVTTLPPGKSTHPDPVNKDTTSAGKPVDAEGSSIVVPMEAPDATMPERAVKVEPLQHSDLLGPQIKDPQMRQKVQDLYKRPDVIVQQYVLPIN